jgi:hypothetical protein
MSTVDHISFEKLAGNLAAILNKVRDEHTTIVVEYASGEKLIIKPLAPTRLDTPEDQRDITLQQPQKRVADTGEVGSAGAIYELDPNGLTPG